MADINAPEFNRLLAASPDGATITEELSFTGAVPIADVVLLAILPQGTRVPDGHITLSRANTGATASLGWRYVDGSDSEPAEFIAANTSIAAAGVVRFNTFGPRTVLAKDAYLILTVAGAALAADTVIRARPQLANVGTE